jgi:hypothetical protein
VSEALTGTGRVVTDSPSRYLAQLCEHFRHESRRHFGQEIEVSFSDLEGFVDFAPFVSGTLRLDARQDGVLALEARGADPTALERIQQIVGENVERLGKRDGLTVEWS